MTLSLTDAITRSRQLRYNQERLRKVRLRVFDHEERGMGPKHEKVRDLLLQRIEAIKSTMNNPNFA